VARLAAEEDTLLSVKKELIGQNALPVVEIK
jgi:hypothetical protein